METASWRLWQTKLALRDAGWWCRDRATDALLLALRRLNTNSDRSLAARLRTLADRYDPKHPPVE